MADSKLVQVKLEGDGLKVVLDEQKKYIDKDKYRGKGVIVNRLLCELYKLKNKK